MKTRRVEGPAETRSGAPTATGRAARGQRRPGRGGPDVEARAPGSDARSRRTRARAFSCVHSFCFNEAGALTSGTGPLSREAGSRGWRRRAGASLHPPLVRPIASGSSTRERPAPGGGACVAGVYVRGRGSACAGYDTSSTQGGVAGVATPRGCVLAPPAGAPNRGRLVDPRTSGAGLGLALPVCTVAEGRPFFGWTGLLMAGSRARREATGGERERTRAAAGAAPTRPGLGNSDARLCRAGTAVARPVAERGSVAGRGRRGRVGALAMLARGLVGWCVSPRTSIPLPRASSLVYRARSPPNVETFFPSRGAHTTERFPTHDGRINPTGKSRCMSIPKKTTLQTDATLPHPTSRPVPSRKFPPSTRAPTAPPAQPRHAGAHSLTRCSSPSARRRRSRRDGAEAPPSSAYLKRFVALTSRNARAQRPPARSPSRARPPRACRRTRPGRSRAGERMELAGVRSCVWQQRDDKAERKSTTPNGANARRAERGIDGGEAEPDDERARPVELARDGLRLGDELGREHLRDDEPRDRAEADREEEDEAHHAAERGDGRDQLEQRGRDDAREREHAARREREQRRARRRVHHRARRDGRGDVDGADHHGAEVGVVDHALEERRRVVEDRVDAAQLLREVEAEHRAEHPPVRRPECPASPAAAPASSSSSSSSSSPSAIVLCWLTMLPVEPRRRRRNQLDLLARLLRREPVQLHAQRRRVSLLMPFCAMT